MTSKSLVETSFLCYLPTKQVTKLTALEHALLSNHTYDNCGYGCLFAFFYSTLICKGVVCPMFHASTNKSNQVPAVIVFVVRNKNHQG